jgi:putative phosphoribosyl transferase
MKFRDRADAGRRLAAQLIEYEDRFDVLVLALPRGGVPVGFEIAARLEVPLDVFRVRKLGVPGRPELAMGAIAAGRVQVLHTTSFRTSGSPRRRSRRLQHANGWSSIAARPRIAATGHRR